MNSSLVGSEDGGTNQFGLFGSNHDETDFLNSNFIPNKETLEGGVENQSRVADTFGSLVLFADRIVKSSGKRHMCQWSRRDES